MRTSSGPARAKCPKPRWRSYVYERDNPAGRQREYWHHSAGCRAWIVVTRDTRTHRIESAECGQTFGPELTAVASATQPFRLPKIGLVDRNAPLTFRFDGQSFSGFRGDTLASALLANGVRLVGRLFKYHRPRGLLTAGPEEPNGLVELRSGARREPNTRATVAELYDGLEASSQNCWPSLDFDFLSVNALFAPALTAGFYYKTFMWPASFWERLYEPAIRRAAGLGRAANAEDPDVYEKAFAFCDVLVIGGGPAGLSAALAAGRAGARVILCDDDFELGGRLLSERREIDGRPASQWLAQSGLGRCDIASVPSVAVTLLPRAIARVRQAEGLFDIHVRDIDSSAIVDAVENGVVETGLCVPANKRPELTFEALFREPLDFVCRADHPLTKKKAPLKWAQLAGCGLILNGSVSALGLPEVAKLAANSKLIASNVNSNLAMVEAGLGVTILPRLCRWQCSRELCFMPLADAAVSRTVGWIAREGRALQPATAKLLNCIRGLTRECAKEFGYAAV